MISLVSVTPRERSKDSRERRTVSISLTVKSLIFLRFKVLLAWSSMVLAI